MLTKLITAIVILPGSVLVAIPALIVWLTRDTAWAARPAPLDDVRLWLGVALFAAGLGLAVWTCRLFITVGKGTPAPWHPPRRLVVRGPYRHVRNPMITSVLLMLGAEALMLRSWALAGWLLVVFVGNVAYFPLAEEKELERRFGADYRAYKADVPCWVPRLRPWRRP